MSGKAWNVLGLVTGIISGITAVVELIADSKSADYQDSKFEDYMVKTYGLVKVQENEEES